MNVKYSVILAKATERFVKRTAVERSGSLKEIRRQCTFVSKWLPQRMASKFIVKFNISTRIASVLWNKLSCLTGACDPHWIGKDVIWDVQNGLSKFIFGLNLNVTKTSSSILLFLRVSDTYALTAILPPLPCRNHVIWTKHEPNI